MVDDWPGVHNRPVRIRPAETKQGEVSSLGGFYLAGPQSEDPFQIAFPILMQIPIWWVATNIDVFDESEGGIHLQRVNCAVDPYPLDPRARMIRGAQPCPRLGYNAVSGTGMNGCPLKFARLLNFPLSQVAFCLSQPG